MNLQQFQLAQAMLLLLASPVKVWSGKFENPPSTPKTNNLGKTPDFSKSTESVQLEELKQMLMTVIDVQSTILNKVESLEKSVEEIQDVASYKLHDLEDRATNILQGLKRNNIDLVHAELTYINEHVRGEKSLNKVFAKLFMELESISEEKFNKMTNLTIFRTMLTPDRFFQVLQQLDATTNKFSSDMLTKLCMILLNNFDPLSRTFPLYYQESQQIMTSNETAQRIFNETEDFPRPWTRENCRKIIEILFRKYTPSDSSMIYATLALNSLLISNVVVPQLEGYEILVNVLGKSPESNVTTYKFQFIDQLYQQNQLLLYTEPLSSEQDQRLRRIWCRPVFLEDFEKQLRTQMRIDARKRSPLDLKSLKNFLAQRYNNPYERNVFHNIKQTCESEFIFGLLKNNSQLRETKNPDYATTLQILLTPGTSPELLEKFPFVINDTISSVLNLYSNRRENLIAAIDIAVDIQREISIQATTELFSKAKIYAHINGYEGFYAANALHEHYLTSHPAWEDIPKLARIVVTSGRENLLWSVKSNGSTYQIVVNNSTGILELEPQETRVDKRKLWKFEVAKVPVDYRELWQPMLRISQEGDNIVAWGSYEGPQSGDVLHTEAYGGGDFEPHFPQDGAGFYLSLKGRPVEVLVNEYGKPGRLGRGKTRGDKALFTVTRNQ